MEKQSPASRAAQGARSPVLGIPKCPPWEVAPFPSTAGELLAALRSPGFRAAVADPLAARHVAYSAARTAFFLGRALLRAQQLIPRTKQGTFKDGVPADPRKFLEVTTRGFRPVLANIAELYRRDNENIQRGYYRAPYDMHPAHRQFSPGFVARAMEMHGRYMDDIASRRAREGRQEVRETSKEARLNADKYPDYYLQNFHFQDGWLSEFAADGYEVATEVLFQGSQDAMQRQGLVPLHFFMKGRSQRGTRLLELACGTGRYLTFIKDNYPHMQTVAVDLSPNFLRKARENMDYYTEFDERMNGGRGVTPTEFVQASAEDLPMGDETLDVVSCVYLFHELPPAARENVVKEMARVLRPGGIVIFQDSLQAVDRPGMNFEFFPDNYHEPYYMSYVNSDLEALFAAGGLVLETSGFAHVSKVMCFRKA